MTTTTTLSQLRHPPAPAAAHDDLPHVGGVRRHHPESRRPVIKVSIFLTRRADLDHAAFLSYWTTKHTPLIASLPAGAVPVRRYVQLLATADPTDRLPTATFDGVAEVWVDEAQDAVDWFTSETYRTAVVPDEENFLDRSRTLFLFSEEHHVFG